MHNEICKFMHTWLPNKMEGAGIVDYAAILLNVFNSD